MRVQRKIRGSEAVESEGGKNRRVHLTNEYVDRLKTTGEWYSVADDEVIGLQVRVTPQGGKIYQVRARHLDGRRITVTIGPATAFTVKQARDEARKHIADARKGIDPNETKRSLREEATRRRANTFGGFVEGEYYEKHLTKCKRGDETLQRLRACFKEDFWDVPLQDISAAAVEGWIARRLAEGRAPGTVNRDVTCMKGVLTKAFKWGRISTHPLHRRVDYLDEDRDREARVLTVAEEKRLMEALDARQEKQRALREHANELRRKYSHPEYPSLRDVAYTDALKPMVELSLQTGLRQNEVYSLEWRDVDFEKRRLTVRGDVAKSGSTRYVPLNDEAVRILTTWRDQGERTGLTAPTGLVFPSPRGGGKIDNMKRSWAQALKAAKIEGFRWHDLRATAASRLVNSGANLLAVMRVLGHRSLETTKRYLRSDEELQVDAMNRLARPANIVPFAPRREEEEAAQAD
jgi:integrase